MANVTISYIVVRYKIRKELFNLLDSIYRQKHSPSFEIIVVDNNTEDRIQGELHKKYPEVIYVKNRVNNGLGGGVNLGNKKANGEYLYVINPDMVLSPDSTHVLYSFIKNNKQIGLVSPSYTLQDGTRPNLQVGTRRLTPLRGAIALSIISSIFKNNKTYREFYITDRNDNKDLEVDAVPGGAFLVKKSIFDSIGGFDEKFFLYFEEHDLSNRVKALGLRNYILSDAKVFHIGGIDSVNLQTTKTFQNSRFYYFKKHYGLIWAICIQMFANLNKKSFLTGIFLCVLLAVSLFLRVYRLSELMSFIADQGYFYLSARDMLTNKIIPLVGPPTSHPWIHHGAYWTYALAVILSLSQFNPVIPAYFIAVVGVITVLIFYLVVSKMFSRNVAVVSSILFACSPLIVLNARLPYHTSPIPFFVILLFYSVFKWVKGSVWMFPCIVFLLAVLYNHEITTFVYSISVLFVLIYGLIYKKNWAVKLKDPKVIVISIFSFIIPMIPFLLYDISHGYKQTVGFLVWVLYRIAKTPISLIFPSTVSSGSNPSTLPEFFYYYSQLIFAPNTYIAGLILVVTCLGIFIYGVRNKRRSYPPSYVLLSLFLTLGCVGLFMHRVPIEADTLLISPFIIVLSSLALLYFFQNRFWIAIIITLIMSGLNIKYLIFTEFATRDLIQPRIPYAVRLKAISKIIKLSNGKEYEIKGKGDLGNFPAFTMPYEYLLWYNGFPIKSGSKNIIYIKEVKGKIQLTK